MKVLILTQYFLPENPPGAHRLSSLAKSMVEEGHEVEILTTFPNYPNLKVFDGYKVRSHVKEQMDGYTIHRSWIYLNPKKKIHHRLLAFISFLFSSLYVGLFKVQKPDVIICLSPPIFTCFTAIALKWKHRCKLFLNIADLWPESGIKLGIIKNKLLIKILTKCEEYFYNHSEGILCQTQGILNNIQARTTCKNLFWFKNGVDFSVYEKYEINKTLLNTLQQQKTSFQIGYAGLVGYAQGMEVVVNAAQILQQKKIAVSFLIVGDGPKLNELQQLASQYQLSNFTFAGNQPKHLMPTYLSAMDITLVPLRKTDIFMGALPSKIFDSFAVKKSVILGVDGEARELFCNQYPVAYYYEPDNATELAHCIEKIIAEKQVVTQKGEQGYQLMQSHFNRQTINKEVISFISTHIQKP